MKAGSADNEIIAAIMRFALLPDKICFTIALYHIGRSKCRKSMEYPLREIRRSRLQCLFHAWLFVDSGRGIGADAGQEQNTNTAKAIDRFSLLSSFDDCRSFAQSPYGKTTVEGLLLESLGNNIPQEL